MGLITEETKDGAPLVPTLAPTPVPSSAEIVEVEEECSDTPNFLDEYGFLCSNWKDHECTRAEQWMYTPEGGEDVLKNCKESCGLCVRRRLALESKKTKTKIGLVVV